MMAIARMSPSPAAPISARFMRPSYKASRRFWHLAIWRRKTPAAGPGFSHLRAKLCLFAIFAGREVAAVDRLRHELRLVVCPVGADAGVGLEHRVPELVFVVAEHLFLLDLLDVDVLDRALGGEIEPHRTARRIDLDARHGLDELLRAWIFSVVLRKRLVDPHGGRV